MEDRSRMYPLEVLAIARECMNESKEDIGQAVASAKALIQELECYPALVDRMVTEAIRELIYNLRHQENVKIKRQDGSFHTTNKTRIWESSHVKEVYKSAYNYMIGGRTLSLLLGEEIETLAEGEKNRADGHLFNYRLLKTLQPLIPEGRRVKEVLSEQRLMTIFKTVQTQRRGKNTVP